MSTGNTNYSKTYPEILASINFNQKWNSVPWIGDQPYIEILFQQFSNITIFVRVLGKLLDQHFNVSLYSNPGAMFLKTVAQMLCPDLPLIIILIIILNLALYSASQIIGLLWAWGTQGLVFRALWHLEISLWYSEHSVDCKVWTVWSVFSVTSVHSVRACHVLLISRHTGGTLGIYWGHTEGIL